MKVHAKLPYFQVLNLTLFFIIMSFSLVVATTQRKSRFSKISRSSEFTPLSDLAFGCIVGIFGSHSSWFSDHLVVKSNIKPVGYSDHYGNFV